MKETKQHVFLLGPPAVGKLAVGRILSQRTGYPVFDNAKTVDIARLLYPYGTANFRAFRDDLRFRFYKEAAYADLHGLISTYCFRHPDNWLYLTRIAELMQKSDWSTGFILLRADKHTLIRRAQSPDRQTKVTLHTAAEIEDWISSSPRHEDVGDHTCLVINTTSLTVQEVATEICTSIGEPHEHS